MPTVGFILTGIGLAANAEMAALGGDDNKAREGFTQYFVQHVSQRLPNWNVVICHPQHKVAGPTLVHVQHVLKMPTHVESYGYDSYCSPKGDPFIFENRGDGGYLNWAYAGEFSRNGNTLTATGVNLPTPKVP